MNGEYNREKVVKFLDLLIDDIENIEYFNIKDFINKFVDIDEHDKAYLPYSIESYGKTYGLFENTLKSDEWYKLTTKGIELKEYGKGLIKFEKRLKRKLSVFEKISIFFFVITFLFGVFQFRTNDKLENQVSRLENRIKLDSLSIDSLKTFIQETDNSIDESDKE